MFTIGIDTEDFFENNKELYGEEELQNLLLEDGYHDRKSVF